MGEWFRANPHLGYVKGAHIFQTETQPLLYTNQIGIQMLNCSPHPTWASAVERWPSVAADTLQKHRLHLDAELCARGTVSSSPNPRDKPIPSHTTVGARRSPSRTRTFQKDPAPSPYSHKEKRRLWQKIAENYILAMPKYNNNMFKDLI